MARKVVVFGIFDGVHDGHRDFFRQAKEFGDELIVIVGHDAIAQKLKGKKPRYSEQERVKLVEAEPLVDKAILGDEQLSTYTVLVRFNPDAVCLGYDQGELEADLQRWITLRQAQGKDLGKTIELHRVKPYQKDTLHNSLFS